MSPARIGATVTMAVRTPWSMASGSGARLSDARRAAKLATIAVRIGRWASAAMEGDEEGEGEGEGEGEPRRTSSYHRLGRAELPAVEARVRPSRASSSPCVPSSTTRPRSSTTTRSARSTVLNRWAMISVERPRGQLLHGRLDQPLALGVEARGGLVEDHDGADP